MNFYDIVIRYAIGYLIIMLGFLTQSLWVMALGIPFLLIGLIGICPVFNLLGINHNGFNKIEEQGNQNVEFLHIQNKNRAA